MLLEHLLHLLGGWAPVFRQKRTCERAIALALGLLCGLGRRTVTRAICFNNRQHQDWSADYKLFNRSRWDAHALFEPVIQTAIGQYCPKQIVVGLDDTGIKRSGKKIKTAYWQRDPLSPPFHTNLMWGQRFLQASLLTPLYDFDGESSPRGLPIRFEEVTPVRKPGKNATTEQKAAYRQAKKTHNLSRAFVDMLRELRQDFDSHGFAAQEASLPWAMAPSATKQHSANLWIAPSSSPGLAKTCDSVFPTRVKALAIMGQSSSVPKRSIKTPPSPGKRPKSFMALDTEGFATRKSANCSGNVEAVDGFCGSLCSRPPPIARLKRGGAITGKRPTCCATTTSWLPKNFCKPTSIVGKLKSTIATKRVSLEWVMHRSGPI